ncbi:MAG: ATP-binding protein [Yoonia sp.]
MRLDTNRDTPFTSAAEHLAAEFRWLDARLERHLGYLRETGRFDESPMRGVRLRDENVVAGLSSERHDLTPPDQIRALIDARATAGPLPPLYRMAQAFGLDAFERCALFVAAAPALDARYRAALALAQNDATRRWATPDLLIALLDPEARLARLDSFAPDAPLVAAQLLVALEEGGPLADRAFGVEDRIALALNGSNVGLSPALAVALATCDPGTEDWAPDLIDTPVYDKPVIIFEGTRDMGQRVLAARRASVNALGFMCLHLDSAGALQTGDIARAAREARLQGAHLFVEARATPPADLVGELVNLVQTTDTGQMDIAAGSELAHQLWLAAPQRVQRISLPDLDAPARLRWWQRARPDRSEADLARRAWRSRLGPSGIRKAGLQETSRAQLPAILRPVIKRWTRDDLILPAHTAMALDELTAFVSHWPQVLGAWQFADTHPQSRRCLALLSGPPGTGKTMAASVVARGADVPLYRVSLSSVFDKYVGETEKQIDRLFDAAADAGIAVLCDEADALFAARSDGNEAQARFSNLTVSHLLQRIEEHEGLVILTSNLPQNMDDAFTRRIDHAIAIPLPDLAGRKMLWRQSIPAAAACHDDVDLDALAETFTLSGGDISNAVLAAAYLAASQDSPIRMRHLLRAVERELSKIGRTPIASDFGRLNAAR